MRQFIRKILNMIYCCYFKKKQKNVLFSKECIISSQDIFEGNNSISGKVMDSYVGYGTYVSDGCYFANAKIGKYCSIGPDVKMVHGKHPTSRFVSTSPFFYLNKSYCNNSYVDNNLFEPYVKSSKDMKFSIVIGNDVWIGQGTLIMDGICIGDGAVVGAGALVNKNIPPYAVAVGVPAKVVKYRFTKEQISHLLDIKWWDKEEKWLKQNAYLFSDIEEFIDKVIEDRSLDEESK